MKADNLEATRVFRYAVASDVIGPVQRGSLEAAPEQQEVVDVCTLAKR